MASGGNNTSGENVVRAGRSGKTDGTEIPKSGVVRPVGNTNIPSRNAGAVEQGKTIEARPTNTPIEVPVRNNNRPNVVNKIPENTPAEQPVRAVERPNVNTNEQPRNNNGWDRPQPRQIDRQPIQEKQLEQAKPQYEQPRQPERPQYQEPRQIQRQETPQRPQYQEPRQIERQQAPQRQQYQEPRQIERQQQQAPQRQAEPSFNAPRNNGGNFGGGGNGGGGRGGRRP
jgi:hypothetical protein